jgi:hypothetical protein
MLPPTLFIFSPALNFAFDIFSYDIWHNYQAQRTPKEIAQDVNCIVSNGYSNDPILADYEKGGFNGIIIKP